MLLNIFCVGGSRACNISGGYLGGPRFWKLPWLHEAYDRLVVKSVLGLKGVNLGIGACY